MLGLNIWDLFGFAAFIFLILFFYAEENTVWAAFSLGVIVSIILGVFYWIKEGAWPWDLFKKTLTIITLCGVLVELAGRLFNAFKKLSR